MSVRSPVATLFPLQVRTAATGPFPSPSANFHFWKLDEPDFSTRMDSAAVPFAYDMDDEFSRVTRVAGHIGFAAYAPADNLAFLRHDGLYLGGDPFLFAAWFNLDTHVGNQVAFTVGDENSFIRIRLWIPPGGPAWELITAGADGVAQWVTSAVHAPVSQWHFVACGCSPARGGNWISVDDGAKTIASAPNVPQGLTTRPYLMGWINKPLQGAMEVAVYDAQDWTDAQVTALYNGGAGREYYGAAWH